MRKQGKYRWVFNTLYCFRGFKIGGVEQCDGLVLVVLKRSKRRPVCPRRGRSCNRIEAEYVRSARDLDLGGLSCFVQFSEFKLNCRCGYRGYERLDWVREHSHCTRRFEDRVAMLCDHMSVKEVCGVTGLGWRTVKNADMNCIREQLKPLDEQDPIMDEKTAETAMTRLGTWKENVQESMIKEYQSLVKTLDHYLYGVLNYFKHRITNAGSEGFNNKINLIKRRAYGFRDIDYFMLKILKTCGGKKPSP
jgi:transposase